MTKESEGLEEYMNKELERVKGWIKEEARLLGVSLKEEQITKIAKKYMEEQIKKKAIGIRLSERDIMLLKKKSREIGIPYQTLIAILVRQYVEGKIKIEL